MVSTLHNSDGLLIEPERGHWSKLNCNCDEDDIRWPTIGSLQTRLTAKVFVVPYGPVSLLAMTCDAVDWGAYMAARDSNVQ